MVKKYLKKLFLLNKEAILMEVLSITGLMHVLMKTRNTDEKWSLPFAYSCRSPRPEENQKAVRKEERRKFR